MGGPKMRRLKLVSVFVLLELLLSAMSGGVMAQEPPPDQPGWDENEGIVLQTGEPLTDEEVDHLRMMLRFYKANEMTKQAELVTRMLAGNLSSTEMKRMAASKLRGYPGLIDSDDYTVAAPHHLYTTVSRHWWMLGNNEHTGWSFNAATLEDIEIAEIEMTAQAWDSSGVPAYDVTFGFDNASQVYCERDDAPSSGEARSEVYYKYGPNWYDYHVGIAEGTY
jgi:hypothetical protein